MRQPQPPPGFVTIGPGIYISLATISATASQPNMSAPNVILIFGWSTLANKMFESELLTIPTRSGSADAPPATLFPEIRRIIPPCYPDHREVWTIFLLDLGRTQNRLLPVVEALGALGCLPAVDSATQASPRVRPRILVHSFSNGGGYQLTTLSRLLSSKYPSMPPSEQLVSALVIDSSPATMSFRSIGLAFSIAIRNPVARYIVLFMMYFMHALSLSLHMVFGGETSETQYPKTLLHPRLLPWTNAQTPRLYVFSKKDELVPWKYVQGHAEAAKKSGLDVRCELYEESAHVAHMRLDPKRYWASILDLWQVACRESQMKAVEAASDTDMNRCTAQISI